MEEKKTNGLNERELTEEELNRVTGGVAQEIKMYIVDCDMVCDHFYQPGSSSSAFSSPGLSGEERCCGVCHYFLKQQGEREGVCARCDNGTYRQRGQMSPGKY